MANCVAATCGQQMFMYMAMIAMKMNWVQIAAPSQGYGPVAGIIVGLVAAVKHSMMLGPLLIAQTYRYLRQPPVSLHVLRIQLQYLQVGIPRLCQGRHPLRVSRLAPLKL